MQAALMETVNAPAAALSECARRVRQALFEQGLETPLVNTGLSRDQKYEVIRDSFTEIARALGLDLKDDSLCETPLDTLLKVWPDIAEDDVLTLHLDEQGQSVFYSNDELLGQIEDPDFAMDARLTPSPSKFQ